MRRIALLIAGLFLVVLGLVVMLLPVPIPLGGIVYFAIGCAILSANSRMGRRAIQRVRHRSAHLSGLLERLSSRAPESWARALRRTRPDAIVRRMKMKMTARKA